MELFYTSDRAEWRRYLSEHFEIGFAYNIALGSTADASWKQATDAAFHSDDTKPKSWQISAAYYF